MLKGGVYIYGEQINGPASFSRGLFFSGEEEGKVEIEIPGGEWRFLAIAWEGPQILEGKNRCSMQLEDIKGEKSVIFYLSSLECNNEYFSGVDNRDSEGQFHRLRFVACLTLEGITNANSSCSYPLSKMGLGLSYKIQLAGTFAPPMLPDTQGLLSQCLSGNDPSSSSYLTQLKLPLGSINTKFPLDIISYSGTHCEKEERRYSLKQPHDFLTLSMDSFLTIGTVGGIPYNHFYFPDNFYGGGKSILTNQSPSIDCKTGHCLYAKDANTNPSSAYLNVKRLLEELIGSPNGQTSANTNQERREVGAIGDTAWILEGPIGTSLHDGPLEQGVVSCSGLPSQGRFPSFESEEEFFFLQEDKIRFDFLTPVIPVPDRMSSTDFFEKRLGLTINGSVDHIFEFNCTNKMGWMRSEYNENNTTFSRELYYDASNPESAQAEYYSYQNYTYEGKRYRSRKAIQFKKQELDDYLAHMTETQFNESTNQHASSRRYLVKSSGNKMTIHAFEAEDASPNSVDQFTSCLEPLCTTYCLAGNGTDAIEGCPIVTEEDEVKEPLLSAIPDFSTESINAGAGPGWPDLTALSLLLTGLNTAPKLAGVPDQTAAVGSSYSLDINDSNTGEDKDKDGDHLHYECSYKNLYVTQALGLINNTSISSVGLILTSLNFKNVASAIYSFKDSTGETSNVTLKFFDSSGRLKGPFSLTPSNYETLGGKTLFDPHFNVDKIEITSSPDAWAMGLLLSYENTSSSESSCSSLEGLSFNTVTGQLTGIPTKGGEYQMTMKASDGKTSRKVSFPLAIQQFPTFVFASSANAPALTASNVSLGETINIYSNSGCSTSSLKGSATALEESHSISLSGLNEGTTNSFYYQKTTASGLSTNCLTTGVSYTPPLPPTSVAMVPSTLNSGTTRTPTIKVSGLTSAHQVKLYAIKLSDFNNLTNPSSVCGTTYLKATNPNTPSNSALGSEVTFGPNNHNFTTSLPDEDSDYKFFAQSFDEFGLASSCSNVSALYTLDRSGPSVPPSFITLTSPSNNAGSTASVTLNLSGGSITSENTLRVYSDSNCSSILGLVTGYQISGSSLDVTLDLTSTSPGLKVFYAKTFDQNENASPCSNASISDTYDFQPDTDGDGLVDSLDPSPSIATVPSSYSAADGSSLKINFSSLGSGVYKLNDGRVAYVDMNTDSGGWTLVYYGERGSTGGHKFSDLDISSNGFGVVSPNRRGIGIAKNALSIIQNSNEMAISWDHNNYPTGDILTYDYAIKFSLTNPNSLTLTGQSSDPGQGGGTNQFSLLSTHSQTLQKTLSVLSSADPGLPTTMYMRGTTFGVSYGKAYGLVTNPGFNNQLDWGPDGQNFQAIYINHSGNTLWGGFTDDSGFVTTGGTQNGTTPKTMAIWVRNKGITPGSVSLSTTSSNPGSTIRPSISISGVDTDHTIYLYTESSCSSSKGNRTGSGTLNLASDLSTGVNNFWFKLSDGLNTSSCTSHTFTYTYTTFPSSNLKLWLDANESNSIIKDASNKVTQWKDLSGHNHHANSSGISSPTYVTNALNGLPVLTFNGNSHEFLVDETSGRINTDQDATIVTVFKTTSGGTLLSRSPATGNWAPGGKTLFSRWGHVGLDIGWISYLQGQHYINDGNPTLSVALLDYIGSSDTLTFYTNGASDGVKNWNMDRFPESSFVLKIGFTNSNFPTPTWFNGDIAEILIFDKVLTTLERENVESYLMNKWGL